MNRALNSKQNKKRRSISSAKTILLLFYALSFLTRLPAQDIAPLMEAPFELFLDGQSLGDTVILTDGSSVLLPLRFLENELTEAMSDSAYQTLAAMADQNGYLTETALKEVNIDIETDFDFLLIHLRIPLASRRLVYLSKREKAKTNSGNIVEPSFFSFYLNSSLRTDTDWTSGIDLKTLVSTNFEGAVNIGSWVSEASAAFAIGEKARSELRYLRLVKDFRDQALRASAGMVKIPAKSQTPALALYGLSLIHQPQVASDNYSPNTPRRVLLDEFTVATEAVASISVNGARLFSKTLAPGKYQFADLPFSSGLNDIEVTIKESDKEAVAYQLSEAHDDSLLIKGGWDFGAGLGFTELALDSFSFSAYSVYGFTHTLTASLSAQADLGSSLVNLGLNAATAIGQFGGDAVISLNYNQNSTLNAWGFAGNLDYALFFPGRAYLPSLNISAGWTNASFVRPGYSDTAKTTSDAWRFSAHIQQRFPGGFAFNASGNYAISGTGRLSYGFSAGTGLTTRTGAALSLSAKTMWIDSAFIPRLDLYATFIPKSGDGSYRYSHDLFTGESAAGLVFSDDSDGQTRSAKIDITNPLGPADSSASLQAGGQLLNDLIGLAGDFSLNYKHDGQDASYSASTDIDFALAYAGGEWALSRRITDSFALIAPTSSFGEQTVEVRGGGKAVSCVGGQTAIIPALPSYTARSLSIETPNSPPNIAARETSVQLFPLYRSGTLIRPEPVHAVVITGRLTNPAGTPLAWMVGQAINTLDNTVVDFFCDDNGYFELYDIQTGDLSIRLPGMTPVTLTVTDEGQDRIDVGTLIVSPEER